MEKQAANVPWIVNRKWWWLEKLFYLYSEITSTSPCSLLPKCRNIFKNRSNRFHATQHRKYLKFIDVISLPQVSLRVFFGIEIIRIIVTDNFIQPRSRKNIIIKMNQQKVERKFFGGLSKRILWRILLIFDILRGAM